MCEKQVRKGEWKMKTELCGISKSIGGRNVLDDISFTFRSGNRYVISGRSGAGKTTLLNIIAGYLPVDSGRISCGENQETSYMFQDDLLFSDLTLYENMRLVMSAKKLSDKRMKEMEKVLEILGIKFLLNTKIRCFSGGERKRAAMICALLPGPDVLLMDEPVAALDRESRKAVQRCICTEAKEAAVIIVTHEHMKMPGAVYLELEKGSLAYEK